MKYAVVIVDGAAGWPMQEWGNKTTLEAAHTPNLDALVREGVCGMAETVPPTLEASSSVACTSIVGYDPEANYVGRGAIEGAALGIDLQPRQIAMRCNFCSVDDAGRMTSYSTDNMEDKDASSLAEELKIALDDEVFTLVHGESFKNILVINGLPGLLEAEFMPSHNIADQEVSPHLPSGPDTKKLLEYMDRANAILARSEVNKRRVAEGLLPANTVWPVWPGVRPAAMTPFVEKYGKKAALSSGVDLLKGIALLCGIDFVEIDGVTDAYDNDYVAQAEGCIDALKQGYDVVVCHIESPDTAGHDGLPDEKKRAVELIDQEVIARFREYGKTEDIRILAMPDHPTPLEIKTHSREPVPFVMAGPGVEANGGQGFTEAYAKATGLVVDPGYQLMGTLLASATPRG